MVAAQSQVSCGGVCCWWPAMINGAHVILFTEAADATRDFLGRALGLRAVDAGGGWLNAQGADPPPASGDGSGGS